MNDPGEMKIAMSWGVKAVLTDRVGVLAQLKKEVRIQWRYLRISLTSVDHTEPRIVVNTRNQRFLIQLEFMEILSIRTCRHPSVW